MPALSRPQLVAYALAALVGVPLLLASSPYYLFLLNTIAVFVMLALGLQLVLGYTPLEFRAAIGNRVTKAPRPELMPRATGRAPEEIVGCARASAPARHRRCGDAHAFRR